jgi:hypothetical protein
VLARTSTGARRLGRISRNMIRNGPEPSDRDASMYSFSRMESVWPRTTRPIAAQEKNAITRMAIARLEWKTDTSAIANSR